jgi:hypothetical protein
MVPELNDRAEEVSTVDPDPLQGRVELDDYRSVVGGGLVVVGGIVRGSDQSPQAPIAGSTPFWKMSSTVSRPG